MDFSGVAAEGSLDDMDIDPNLFSQANAIDGELITVEDNPQRAESDEPVDNSAGEMVLDAIEMVMQVFGHERYEMQEGQKALVSASYAKLTKKYEGKAPAFLGQYKEEGMVILLTLILMAGSYKTIKALKAEDAKALKEENGGDNGEKSE